MGRQVASIVLALAVSGIAGCAVLGNVYSMQNHIACPPMTETELRAELRSDAETISRRVGRPVQVIADEPDSFILNIGIPNPAPASFWNGGPQPVHIRMSTEPDGLFIAVYKANDPRPDATTRQAQEAVEKTIAASKCRLVNSYLSQFDMI